MKTLFSLLYLLRSSLCKLWVGPPNPELNSNNISPPSPQFKVLSRTVKTFVFVVWAPPQTKFLVTPLLTCLFFRHDHRILKLRIICRDTRSVFMCKSSVYFCAPHLVCSGNGTRRIVILKTKIKPVSINAAASCNVHIL